MKHKPEITTVGEIINGTPDRCDGWPALDALGLDYDALTRADMARRVQVTWPEHVLTPKYNGDASYSFV